MSHDTPQESPTIFLCYAREDFERVHALYLLLKGLGLRPWLDKYDITGGELWQQAIERAVRKADFFIASFSNASVRKTGFVQREYRLALDALAERPAANIFVIPVRLDDCELPDLIYAGMRLSDLQWVDLSRKGLLTEEDIEPILKAIEVQSNWRRTPPELSEMMEKYVGKLDARIVESLRVRELPHTDVMIELEARAGEAELRELGEKALERYLSVEMRDVYGFDLMTFYLIARRLYRAILEDDFRICKHRAFVYPVHQYLSRMIRGAAMEERSRLVSTLRRWLCTKDIYQTSRDFAAFELGMSRAHEERGALLEALSDRSELPLVRYYAAMSLGMIGSRDVLRRLLEIYRREPEGEIKKVIAHTLIHLSGVNS
jgi:hypothetical protein